MFYKYNKEKLLFEPCYRDLVKILIICFTLSIVIFGAGYITGNLNKSVIELEGEVHVIKEETAPFSKEETIPFSKEALVKMIDELGMKHPHIVLAQSILETGHWTSNIFEKNHNLFGMKQARSRIRTAKGTQLNHAYYDNWKESVYDYAFYQCRYLSKIKNEEDYFAILDASYAEIGNSYSVALKKIIETEKLKELFDEK